VRIKTTARQTIADKFCWYVIPEIIIGVPKYDQAGCIAYVMDTLETNGFRVKYFHPNTVLISWEHWVPSYVRSEIKKKTGITVNEFGERVEEEEKQDDEDDDLAAQEQNGQSSKSGKKYTPINSYKPSGKLVYSEDMLNKIGNRLS
jgi:hypothetical protein